MFAYNMSLMQNWLKTFLGGVVILEQTGVVL